MSTLKKIIISGGGTGGHIYPAIAIADGLKEYFGDPEILFIGAEGRMEMEKIPQSGYPVIGLPIKGFQRKLSPAVFGFFFNVWKSLRMAKRILKEINPDVVVGVGGYASFAVLYEATKMDIPTVIQEQNSYAGITNKILSKRVDKICVAYDKMDAYFPASKIVKTGNPVRNDLLMVNGNRQEAYNYFGLDPEKKTILNLGGSLGAGMLNDSWLDGLEKIKENNLQLIWQTGKIYHERMREEAGDRINDQIYLTDFLNRMDLAYAAADVIVSRAGALSISELSLVGKPVILIPSPNVAEDHQTKNARALENKNAAVMVPDNEARKKLVPEVVGLMSDEQKQKSLAKNIRSMATPDSTKDIVKVIDGLMQ